MSLDRFPKYIKFLYIVTALTLCKFSFAETRMLILGDSLSAGYGLLQDQGWVNLLQNKWDEEGNNIYLINGSISGETTSGGLARLPRLLEQHKPDIVLVELGGNDGLRGYPIKKMRKNLDDIVTLSQSAGATVLISEVMLPTNYGNRYRRMFEDVFKSVSEQHNAPLLPFFMQVVVGNEGLMQKDGLHPNADAQPIIAEFMYEKLSPFIKK